jgi:hypothetical protein
VRPAKSSASGPALPPAAETPGAILHAYARHSLHQAARYLCFHDARLHHGVHLGRKSLRRCRAAMELAASATGADGRRLDRRLKRLLRSLSELRDGQALVEALRRLGSTRAAAAQPALLRRAGRAARKRRAQLARQSHHAGTRHQRDQVAEALKALEWLDWSSLDMFAVLEAVDRSGVRERAAGRIAVATGTDADWHRWRRRARRASQQDRARGEVGDAIAEQNKALALVLGELQDYSLLVDHCGEDSPFGFADRTRLHELANHEIARLRKRAIEIAAKRDASSLH